MMTWKTIVHSEVGTSHKKRNIDCQDYGKCVLIKDLNTVIGAVADGAGSAEHSKVGSEVAVNAVLSHWKEYLGALDKDKIDFRQPISEEKAKKVFNLTLDRVLNDLKTIAIAKSYQLKELACTLIAFVATPDWIAAMQIGDGFIVVHSSEGSRYQLLFKPNKGEYANQTTFVTSSNALSEIKVTVLAGNKKFVCASTDGLERVAINISNWTPGEIFFEPLEQSMQMSNVKEAEKYIVEFLQSEKLNSRTDDDKTLLVCLYDKNINQEVLSSETQKSEESETSSVKTASTLTENTKQNLTKNITSDEQTKTTVPITSENTDEPVKSLVINSSPSGENSQESLLKDVDCEEHEEQSSIPSRIDDTEELADSSAEISYLSKEKMEDDQST